MSTLEEVKTLLHALREDGATTVDMTDGPLHLTVAFVPLPKVVTAPSLEAPIAPDPELTPSEAEAALRKLLYASVS
jgi:hypothetical protein